MHKGKANNLMPVKIGSDQKLIDSHRNTYIRCLVVKGEEGANLTSPISPHIHGRRTTSVTDSAVLGAQLLAQGCEEN